VPARQAGDAACARQLTTLARGARNGLPATALNT
jgi:hypothetical protein